MNYEIREMLPHDEVRVLEILKQGIDSGMATLETELPSAEAWNSTYYNDCRWVLENDASEVVGWCALKTVSKKDFFKGVAEVSIYLDNNYIGKGLGTMLLKKLIVDSENHGFWTLQSNLFSENEAAIRFHQKNGFKIIGKREKVAQLHSQWKDLIFMERRSKSIF